MATTRRVGYLLILFGAILFGLSATLSKIVLDAGLDPLAASLYTQAIAGIVYLPTLRRNTFHRGDWRFVLFLATVGGVLAPILYFVGIQRTTAGNAALLQNGEPLFTVVFAYLLLKERVNAREWVLIAVVVLGAMIVATNLEFTPAAFAGFWLGNALLIGASACWGLDDIASAVVTRRTSIPAVLSARLLLGSAILVPVLWALGTPLGVPAAAILPLLVLSLLTIAVYAVVLYRAFQLIGPLRSGAVLSSSALWGVLIALYVFPTQVPSAVQLLGGAMMVLALVGLYVFGRSADRSAG